VTVKAVRRGIIYSKPAFFYGKATPNLGMLWHVIVWYPTIRAHHTN